jgi:catechol 2,3-dioxygenase-like lactoylglutathione lyase family enzyme
LGSGKGVDHVGIAVRDLDSRVQLYRDRLGFTVGDLGKHPGGTANAGIHFKKKTYLELISVYDRERAAKGPGNLVPFLDKHEGTLFVGLEVESAERAAAYLRGRGFEIGGPESGTWTPDDVEEKVPELWKSIWFVKPFDPGEHLFFIQYEPHEEFWSKLEEKYPKLKQDPAKKVHSNGALRLQAVWMNVKNLADSTKAYEAIGLARGSKMELSTIGAMAQEIQAGEGALLLLTPDVPGGVADKFMADRGESMMGVSIEVEDLEKTRAVLKRGLHQEFAVYSGPFGKSVLVPGDLAAGAWIEFFEKGK